MNLCESLAQGLFIDPDMSMNVKTAPKADAADGWRKVAYGLAGALE